MSQLDRLTFIRDISFEEVFEYWRGNEEGNVGWRETATKIKGWSSWEEWRRYQASLAGLEQRAWKFYEIGDPCGVVPEFLVGPFQSWQMPLSEEDRNNISFAEYVEKRHEWAKSHRDIMNLSMNFPGGTKMMGLYLEDRDKIVCYEGTHRCAGLALAAAEGRQPQIEEKPLISLTVIQGDSKKLMDELLSMTAENPDRIKG